MNSVERCGRAPAPFKPSEFPRIIDTGSLVSENSKNRKLPFSENSSSWQYSE
jgi:hypothetical protein